MIVLINNIKRHQKINNNNGSSPAFKGNFMDGATDSIANRMPKITVSENFKIFNNNISCANQLKKLGGLTPWQQRGIVALIELSTQPAMDWYANRKESKETKKCSLAKTFAKIIAGASVGMCMRAGTVAIFNKLAEKRRLPKELLSDKKLAEGFKHATSIAVTVIAMFTVDLPLTNYIINTLLKRMFPEKYKKKAKSGEKVSNG